GGTSREKRVLRRATLWRCTACVVGAFSDEVDTVSRRENASKQKTEAEPASGGCSGSKLTWVQYVFLEHFVRGIDFDQRNIIAPEIGEMLQYALGIGLVELRALDDGMTQHQPAIAREIDVHHFDIGVDEADVILLGQFAANTAVAPPVMNGVDPDAGPLLGIVVEMEHAELAHQPRAEELPDKTLVAIIGPDIA